MKNLTLPSSKYSNITYKVFSNSFEPRNGFLEYVLLQYNIQVTAILEIKNSMLNDYSCAKAILAYKYVKNKRQRRKSSHLKRKDLEAQIIKYKLVMSDEFYAESKILVLNDTILDADIGDNGIQCMFVFERHDKSHETYLNPGAALTRLTEMIGLSVFEAEDINEVLNNMINEMTDLFMVEVIPNTKLQNTPALRSDVLRYLKLCFLGEG